jgi:hypothetical protein
MPSSVGVLGRRGARRPDGTFAEALLAVPPSGAGPPAAAPGAADRSSSGRPRSGTTRRESLTGETATAGRRCHWMELHTDAPVLCGLWVEGSAARVLAHRQIRISGRSPACTSSTLTSSRSAATCIRRLVARIRAVTANFRHQPVAPQVVSTARSSPHPKRGGLHESQGGPHCLKRAVLVPRASLGPARGRPLLL